MTHSIFAHHTSTFEEFLRMNSDKTFTYWSANDGWAATRQGSLETELTMSGEAARQRWPQYAGQIDAALKGD